MKYVAYVAVVGFLGVALIYNLDSKSSVSVSLKNAVQKIGSNIFPSSNGGLSG